MPSAPLAPSSASTAGASQEQVLLKSLIGALKRNADALPQEVQTLMQNANIKSTQITTEQMVSQIKGAGKAKEQLQEAYAARQTMHKAWKEFLLEAANRWAGFAEDFAKEDTEITQRIEAAKEVFQQAKAQLAASKTETGLKTEATQIDSSDEEESLGIKEAEEVQQGLNNMTQTLKTLQAQANKMVEADGREEKRRRKAEARENQVAGADATMPAASEPPFGAAATMWQNRTRGNGQRASLAWSGYTAEQPSQTL